MFKMTPQEAIIKIQNSISCRPSRGDRWGLRLWKKWRKQYIKNNEPKGFRIPEYESVISQNFVCLFWYATQIVRNKLPSKLHNIMVSYGISNPDDADVRSYFEMVERLEK